MPLAGGQSLLATLNLRLSSPKILVDLSGLKELTGQSCADGFVRLGAFTLHRELLELELVKKHVPLLARAATHIGHVAIRNRGTLGGSLAYADPAAELPACAVVLGATLEIGGPEGERFVRRRSSSKVCSKPICGQASSSSPCAFPIQQKDTEVGFAELARRHGDFPLVGLAVAGHRAARPHRQRAASLFRIGGSCQARSVGVVRR